VNQKEYLIRSIQRSRLERASASDSVHVTGSFKNMAAAFPAAIDKKAGQHSESSSLIRQTGIQNALLKPFQPPSERSVSEICSSRNLYKFHRALQLTARRKDISAARFPDESWDTSIHQHFLKRENSFLFRRSEI
jgi:hypothetical protein